MRFFLPFAVLHCPSYPARCYDAQSDSGLIPTRLSVAHYHPILPAYELCVSVIVVFVVSVAFVFLHPYRPTLHGCLVWLDTQYVLSTQRRVQGTIMSYRSLCESKQDPLIRMVPLTFNFTGFVDLDESRLSGALPTEIFDLPMLGE